MDDAGTPRIAGLTLGRRLGAGSTGTVYAARRDLDGWACAVKVTGDLDPRVRAEVRQEAALLGSIRLPHLIALHEVAECSDGRLGLVLDLVDGGTVGELVAQRGRCTPAETVTVLAPVLRTLAELHRRGIVHGDVSAANVLLTREGRPMLTDLGRARLVGQLPPSVGGTPEYLAPEVNAPGPPTAAADVYAAGALGWRMLTGEPVPPGLVRRPLAEVVPRCPAALGFVLDDCLRGDPAARPTPERAADAVLAACRAGPLQLPDGPDPADQLTLRLREGLGRSPYRQVGSGGPGVVTGPAARGALGTAGAGSGRHRRPARRVVPHRPRGRRLGLVRYVVAGLGAFVAAYAGVHWLGLGRSSGEGAAGATPAMTTAASTATTTTTATTTATTMTTTMTTTATTTTGLGSLPAAGLPTRPPPPRPGPAVDAAGDDATAGATPNPAGPVAALAALVDTRARAYREADPSLLDRVYLPGAPAGAADRSDVRALRRGGLRYDGLRYAVVGPVIERVGADGVVIRVRIDSGQFVVRRSGAPGRVKAAAKGTPLRLHLARTPSGWRVAQVRPG